jgi:hypothetical protein
MLKIMIASFFARNTKYSVSEKINGAIGDYADGYTLYQPNTTEPKAS